MRLTSPDRWRLADLLLGRAMTALGARAWLCLILVFCVPGLAFAQRELHWDTLAVTAHLNADGSLTVAEDQTIIFNGDWNGGERTFNIRPRQRLAFEGMSWWDGSTWQPMNERSSPSAVNDYALTNSRTLRWRGRLAADPPFSNALRRYQLRYTLSGVVKQDGTNYVLDHDFAFPDRDGVIVRYELRLTLDPVWQADSPVAEVHRRSNLGPGSGYVLTLTLRHAGSETPTAVAGSRSPEVRAAARNIVAVTFAAIVLLFIWESARGRFAPLATSSVDEVWLREHILKFPAEVVSAAWDDRVNQSEVVTILARMTVEGKLQSHATGSGKHAGMSLALKVPRTTLESYERALVDALFFDNRTTTSTTDVKSHYRKTGFNPVGIIQSPLQKVVESTMPTATARTWWGLFTLGLFAVALTLLGSAWFRGDINDAALILLTAGSFILDGFASISGRAFRGRMDWGYGAALLCLLSPLFVAAAWVAFLWYPVGEGTIELPPRAIVAVEMLGIAVIITAINALRTRQRREGIAFRKRLVAARRFFITELEKPQPALRDDWYPWLLAFDLGKKMDDWSASAARSHHADSSGFTSSSSSSGSTGSSSGWTGFAGGGSGGAGASATWAAAAGGLAAGVAAPRSSGSGGGSSGGGGGGGGGSSGGGGGGGW